jgi:hypothetical protein
MGRQDIQYTELNAHHYAAPHAVISGKTFRPEKAAILPKSIENVA